MIDKVNDENLNSKFDSRQFRESLSAFVTGVTILDPPLILWSIGRDSNCFDTFMNAQSFAVHVLTKNQAALSDKFAQTGVNKFEDIVCNTGLNGIPILSDFSVCFQCTTRNLYDGGDHVIIVGQVESIENKDQEPLVFYKGSYLSI